MNLHVSGACFTLVLASLFAASSPATAAHWDLIHADRMDVRLCSGCGFGLSGQDFALLVNKGSEPITASELFGATFTVWSSEPGFTLIPFINDPGSPAVAPVQPNEAIGSTQPLLGGEILPPLLLSTESYRNTTPYQVLGFQIFRDASPYEGPVQFDIAMQMGGESLEFSILAQMTLGEHGIQFTRAARGSSHMLPTGSAPTTWGRIKQLYR